MKLWGSTTTAADEMEQQSAPATGKPRKRDKRTADPGPERTGMNAVTNRALVAGVYGLIGLGALGGVAGAVSAMNTSEVAPAPVQYVATTSAEGAAVTYLASWLQATQTDQQLMKETTGAKLPIAPQNRVRYSNLAVADAERTTQEHVVSVTVSALVDVSDQEQKKEQKKATASQAPAPAAGEDPAAQAKQTAQEAKKLAEEALQAAADPAAPKAVTYEVRYWQMPVYEGPDGQVQVVGYPTPVPAPQRVGQELTLDYPERLDPLAELGQTVTGFLQSYAAGQGDASRYVAPGADVRGIAPAPYREVEVMEMRSDHRLEDLAADQPLRLLVQAEATLGSDKADRQALSFALTVQKREDRWEVTAVDPAPLITAAPAA